MKRTLSRLLGLTYGLRMTTVEAATFNGEPGGLQKGLNLIANKFTDMFEGELTDIAVKILNAVLDLVGFLAVIMIVIAGIFLIFGQGSDESKTKAKNIILWTGVGLLVIILSRSLVGFVVNLGSSL